MRVIAKRKAFVILQKLFGAKHGGAPLKSQHHGDRNRQISVSVRLASSVCEIPGRPELRRETVSKQWFEDEDQNK